MPSSSASCWPFSVETTRFSSQSHLLPMRILLTPSVACCSTFANQVRMSVKGSCQPSHAWGVSTGSCGERGCGVIRRAELRCRSTVGKGEREHTVKRPLVRDVVDEEDAHGAAVVGGGDGAEALLAGGIPYLELDALAVQLDGADLEVDADGRDEGRREGVFAEAQQTAGLAYARVADQQQLDLGCWSAICAMS